MGLTSARAAAILDAELVATDYIMWSVNGTTETANVPRVAVAAWGAATVADPAEKTHTGILLTGGASGAAVVSHWSVNSAAAAGTQKTDWEPFTGAVTKTLAVGDKLEAAASALKVRLT